MNDPHISPILPIQNQAIRNLQKNETMSQQQSEEGLQDLYETSLFNPSVQQQRFRSLDQFKNAQQKQRAENPEEFQILSVQEVEGAATQFEENNPELNNKTLLILKNLIKPDDTAEEILAKVFSIYPDPSLADEALDFLIQTANPDTLDALKEAKELLNRDYERQVKAGRNIGEAARAFSKEGLGSPTSLRDMYRDITGNRRDPLKLFDELADKYPYNKLKPILIFLLHSLGSDMKSKGPSIERADLARLIEETRSMQGILGLFRFFHSRAKLTEKQFEALGLKNSIHFEILARIFVKMLAERFVNPEKFAEVAKALGLSQYVAAQIVIFSQMYDALRQVSPRYYRSPQHKNELSKTFITVLEKLDQELEEEKRKKREEERKKKKKEEE